MASENGKFDILLLTQRKKINHTEECTGKTKQF